MGARSYQLHLSHREYMRLILMVGRGFVRFIDGFHWMPRWKIVRAPLLLSRPLRRAVGVWLILGVLFIRALVPFGLTGAAAAPASTFSYSIVLCTPNGLKVIRFDDQGRPLPERVSDGGSCVLCMPLSKGDACAPDLWEALLQIRLPAGHLPKPEDSEVSGPAVWFDAAFPRAPPVSA